MHGKVDTFVHIQAMQARPVAPPHIWLRDRSFDLSFFIFGIAAAGLLLGWTAVARPQWFPVLVALDVWLLGQIHVASTFTRLTFDTESFARYKPVVVWVPVMLLGACAVLVAALGPWILATTYLYWQWFHYTRQSYGISRAYLMKAGGAGATDNFSNWTFYLLPLWGILYRSYQSPSTYLGMELKVVPVPFWMVEAFGIAATATLAWWGLRQLMAIARGTLPVAYSAYMLSHVAIFLGAYILIEDINHGWLAINLWHNVQYIAYVWVFNNTRFKDGISAEHRFLSSLSQRSHLWRYMVVCLIVSVAFTLSIIGVLAFVASATLPLALVVYQTINFHHYVADSIIWKRRPGVVQIALGMAR
ncbi:MAG: hypothetical protein HYX76_15480 [Acidobacteria bacterium]|nr:hypothetical protein [Acidobacteriota bacterium]